MYHHLKHNNWDLEAGQFIFDQYQEVYPLLVEEKAVMRILLIWPQEFWMVGHQYFYECLPWPLERYVKKLQHKINSRLGRERFIKEFGRTRKA
jgi:hypothetical protein